MAQPEIRPLQLVFAPLKTARTEYLVQKAVEMGVSDLHPVIMDHGQISKIAEDKWRRYAIEAAEQCGILSIPRIHPIQSLEATVTALSEKSRFIFCDEISEQSQLSHDKPEIKDHIPTVIIGPEGGFSKRERVFLASLEKTDILSLGPRILRADTAMVAALALVQSTLGDWYS